MGLDNRATDEQVRIFEKGREEILSAAQTWDLASRRYLEEVLNQLETMTADYSYGNGDLYIEDNPLWKSLDPSVVIPKINQLLRASLNITISNQSQFPTVWFDSFKEDWDMEKSSTEKVWTIFKNGYFYRGLSPEDGSAFFSKEIPNDGGFSYLRDAILLALQSDAEVVEITRNSDGEITWKKVSIGTVIGEVCDWYASIQSDFANRPGFRLWAKDE